MPYILYMHSTAIIISTDLGKVFLYPIGYVNPNPNVSCWVLGPRVKTSRVEIFFLNFLNLHFFILSAFK